MATFNRLHLDRDKVNKLWVGEIRAVVNDMFYMFLTIDQLWIPELVLITAASSCDVCVMHQFTGVLCSTLVMYTAVPW